jgi:hypothetical protein
MFGHLALRDYYPQLTASERDEREEICVDALPDARPVHGRRGVSASICRRRPRSWVDERELFRQFRVHPFTRIVPIVREIGLCGLKVCTAFEDMGVMTFADSDIDGEMAGDETTADDFDRQHLAHVQEAAASA